MEKNKPILLLVGILFIGAVLVFGYQALGAGPGGGGGQWVPPAQQFPAGNTTPPVDVGSIKQTKTGEFGANVLESNRTSGAGIVLQPNASLQSLNNTLFLSTAGSAYLNTANNIIL